MTANNIESTRSTRIVEISSHTEEIVEIELAGETDEVKRETKALIQALKRRAQAETGSVSTFNRETYLNAVRRAREAVEGKKLVEPQRLEYAWAILQDEAEKNWYLLMKDVAEFSVRVQKAVKAAWEAFNSPYSQR